MTRVNHVFNRVKGPKHRFDISVFQWKPVAAHGLLGQSFVADVQNGRLDEYPESGEYTTTSMGEGSIRGVASDYK